MSLPEPQHETPTWMLPPVVIVFASVLAVMSAAMAAGLLFPPLGVAVGTWLTEIFVFLGVPWVLIRAGGRAPARATGLKSPEARPMIVGAVLGAGTLLALGIPTLWLWRSTFSEEARRAFDQAQIFTQDTSFETALVAVGVCLAAPCCEEFFFRGVLQNFLRRWRLGPVTAVGVTALAFSAFHFNPIVFPSLVILGVLFGALYEWTGSLWPSIVAHAANNTLSTVLFFVGGPEESTGAQAGGDVLLACAVGAVAIAGVLALARLRPEWLPRREAVETQVTAPRVTMLRAAAPWLLAVSGLVALSLALDYRGIQMRMLEFREPLPKRSVFAPATESELEAQRKLRLATRRGEMTLEEFAVERWKLVPRTGTLEAPPAETDVPPLPVPVPIGGSEGADAERPAPSK